ncbi:class II aaRS and biotin synthetase [Meira miltonrushii]|uniref:threonine--tRNA ligase n=1 Tax=Meira miltonrushii TaxID=1280837 RepID=A0A316VJS9_9BASI|nr:class II aaRS and biotin synthetase [Meira miltonrushii]PWN37484.1 class II aaRS and biotin synthetase [Meira miltonrushii]
MHSRLIASCHLLARSNSHQLGHLAIRTNYHSKRHYSDKSQKVNSPIGTDHRTIGTEQKLFFTHESSPGTPFMLPHGMRIAGKVERVIRDLYQRWSYDEVLTPQVFKADLWKQSGHWDNYRDDMFGVEGFKEMQERAQASNHHSGGCCGDVAHTYDASLSASAKNGEQATMYGLKPMNCPGHCLLYAAQEHSYRDLPIRYAEFSPLHRNEASGALTGLTRVRRFHQDDAHVFCRVDQIYDEIASMLVMLQDAYSLFGFPKFELALSTRPEQFLGELEDWQRAEDSLRHALDASSLPWTLNEADGAFYGPKIDIRLIDAAGKKHQTATIQLDFQLPRRFDLRYMTSDGTSSARPVMIHRAILGSMERFMAILTENLAGRWPFWLSPRQAVILPTSPNDPELLACAHAVRDQLALGLTPGKKSNIRQRHDTTLTDEQRLDILKAYIPSSHLSNDDQKDKAVAQLYEAAKARERRQPHTFHVEVDASIDKLGKRVRRAHVEQVNFTCVIGPEEMRTGKVQVRSRDQYQGDSTGRPELQQNMGTFTVDELRQLFITLDDHHW